MLSIRRSTCAFGVRGGAGDAQQVLRGGRTQHRVDVDAFLQQRLAEAAQIQLLLGSPPARWPSRRAARQNRARAVRRAAGWRCAAGAARRSGSFRMISRAAPTAATEAARQAGGKYERPRGVLQVIDHGAFGGDEAAHRGQRLAERAHDDIHVVQHAQVLGRARAGGPSTPMPWASST